MFYAQTTGTVTIKRERRGRNVFNLLNDGQNDERLGLKHRKARLRYYCNIKKPH